MLRAGFYPHVHLKTVVTFSIEWSARDTVCSRWLIACWRPHIELILCLFTWRSSGSSTCSTEREREGEGNQCREAYKKTDSLWCVCVCVQSVYLKKWLTVSSEFERSTCYELCGFVNVKELTSLYFRQEILYRKKTHVSMIDQKHP